jgi:hypothetical protein
MYGRKYMGTHRVTYLIDEKEDRGGLAEGHRKGTRTRSWRPWDG